MDNFNQTNYFRGAGLTKPPIDLLQILQLENPRCKTFETLNDTLIMKNQDRTAKCTNKGIIFADNILE